METVHVNKQTNNTFNIKPTGDRDHHLLLAAQRKNTFYEVLLCYGNVLNCDFLLTLVWANLPEARIILLPS